MQTSSQLQSRPIIVAGNGPSMARINYKRLPNEYDVFRVNNFYFEDSYQLGKTVDYFFVGAAFLEQQYINKLYLTDHHEYEIKQMLVRDHDNIAADKRFKKIYPTVKIVNKLFDAYPDIHERLNYFAHHFNLHVTSGIYALYTAICMGYKEIYVVGFDFYEESQVYAFQVGENCKRILTDYHGVSITDLQRGFTKYHQMSFEQSIFKSIKGISDVHLYSIVDDSYINSVIPLADKQNEFPYIPEQKSQNALRDWISLPYQMPGNKEIGASLEKKNIFIKIFDKILNYLKCYFYL